MVSDFCPGLSAYYSKTTRPISFELGIVVGFPVQSIVSNFESGRVNRLDFAQRRLLTYKELV